MHIKKTSKRRYLALLLAVMFFLSLLTGAQEHREASHDFLDGWLTVSGDISPDNPYTVYYTLYQTIQYNTVRYTGDFLYRLTFTGEDRVALPEGAVVFGQDHIFEAGAMMIGQDERDSSAKPNAYHGWKLTDNAVKTGQSRDIGNGYSMVDEKTGNGSGASHVWSLYDDDGAYLGKIEVANGNGGNKDNKNGDNPAVITLAPGVSVIIRLQEENVYEHWLVTGDGVTSVTLYARSQDYWLNVVIGPRDGTYVPDYPPTPEPALITIVKVWEAQAASDAEDTIVFLVGDKEYAYDELREKEDGTLSLEIALDAGVYPVSEDGEGEWELVSVGGDVVENGGVIEAEEGEEYTVVFTNKALEGDDDADTDDDDDSDTDDDDDADTDDDDDSDTDDDDDGDTDDDDDGDTDDDDDGDTDNDDDGDTDDDDDGDTDDDDDGDADDDDDGDTDDDDDGDTDDDDDGDTDDDDDGDADDDEEDKPGDGPGGGPGDGPGGGPGDGPGGGPGDGPGGGPGDGPGGGPGDGPGGGPGDGPGGGPGTGTTPVTTTIPDLPPPLTSRPDAVTPDTPPDDEFVIIDERDTPMGNLPQTGTSGIGSMGLASGAGFASGFGMIGLGLAGLVGMIATRKKDIARQTWIENHAHAYRSST